MDISLRRKGALFEAIAVMGKAFASPVRLDLLAQAPRSVEELARASGQSTANTSQRLQALHAAGMVTREREGARVRYTIAGEEALGLWLALRDVSVAQLAEVERAARCCAARSARCPTTRRKAARRRRPAAGRP
jgi:DNA-binding transcriptional ArsR family regulator